MEKERMARKRALYVGKIIEKPQVLDIERHKALSSGQS